MGSIDLICTNKPNLIVDSGVLSSLNINFHHQIVYSKVNLNVVYLPPYQHLVLDYKRANIDCIRKYFDSVDWHKLLSGINVHQEVKLLNKTILNVLCNYIPSK